MLQHSVLTGRLVVIGCFLLSASSALASEPDLGAVPDMGATTVFETSKTEELPWQMTVHSYVFYGSTAADAPNASLPDPNPGQSLFVYVLEMTNNFVEYPSEVSQFIIANNVKADITAVGFSVAVTPDGFTGNVKPATSSFASLAAQSIVFGFAGENALLAGADPDYAVVWFLSSAPAGKVGSSVIGGQATFQNGSVLGPALPEPSSAILLVMGAMAVLRRRVQA